jgi:oligoendopeptidase F
MVLTRALLEGAVDPAARRRLLASRIEEALGTIHRQVSFTRYELEAHAARARGNVPVEALCDLWSTQAESLYGDAVRRGPLDRWGWAGIPHLIHYRFYCYSYAFGQLLVFALYRLWERDPAAFVPRYEALLAAGRVRHPRGAAHGPRGRHQRPSLLVGGFVGAVSDGGGTPARRVSAGSGCGGSSAPPSFRWATRWLT